jgi:hypothetical protein
LFLLCAALALALILAHGFAQQAAVAAARLVVFEGFYRPT